MAFTRNFYLTFSPALKPGVLPTKQSEKERSKKKKKKKKKKKITDWKNRSSMHNLYRINGNVRGEKKYGHCCLPVSWSWRLNKTACIPRAIVMRVLSMWNAKLFQCRNFADLVFMPCLLKFRRFLAWISFVKNLWEKGHGDKAQPQPCYVLSLPSFPSTIILMYN